MAPVHLWLWQDSARCWRDSAAPQRAGVRWAGPDATVHTLLWCHSLLPESSGEVQGPADTSGQLLVTQPGPVMISLLLQPSKTTVGCLRSRNPPSAAAQAGGQGFGCPGWEAELS